MKLWLCWDLKIPMMLLFHKWFNTDFELCYCLQKWQGLTVCVCTSLFFPYIFTFRYFDSVVALHMGEKSPVVRPDLLVTRLYSLSWLLSPYKLRHWLQFRMQQSHQLKIKVIYIVNWNEPHGTAGSNYQLLNYISYWLFDYIKSFNNDKCKFLSILCLPWQRIKLIIILNTCEWNLLLKPTTGWLHLVPD